MAFTGTKHPGPNSHDRRHDGPPRTRPSPSRNTPPPTTPSRNAPSARYWSPTAPGDHATTHVHQRPAGRPEHHTPGRGRRDPRHPLDGHPERLGSRLRRGPDPEHHRPPPRSPDDGRPDPGGDRSEKTDKETEAVIHPQGGRATRDHRPPRRHAVACRGSPIPTAIREPGITGSLRRSRPRAGARNVRCTPENHRTIVAIR